MEPTNKSLVSFWRKSKPISEQAAIDFLPDADALEKTPLPSGMSATIYILVALVAAVVLWASIFEVDQVVTARGRLVTTTRAPSCSFSTQFKNWSALNRR